MQKKVDILLSLQVVRGQNAENVLCTERFAMQTRRESSFRELYKEMEGKRLSDR